MGNKWLTTLIVLYDEDDASSTSRFTGTASPAASTANAATVGTATITAATTAAAAIAASPDVHGLNVGVNYVDDSCALDGLVSDVDSNYNGYGKQPSNDMIDAETEDLHADDDDEDGANLNGCSKRLPYDILYIA
jgi:hypothetical protein